MFAFTQIFIKIDDQKSRNLTQNKKKCLRLNFILKIGVFIMLAFIPNFGHISYAKRCISAYLDK